MDEQPPQIVRIVYLARLREVLERAGEELPLPRDVGTAGGLRAWLAGRGEVWARELAPQRAVRIAVNHALVGGDAPIRSGDEVAFFPPVTGG